MTSRERVDILAGRLQHSGQECVNKDNILSTLKERHSSSFLTSSCLLRFACQWRKRDILYFRPEGNTVIEDGSLNYDSCQSIPLKHIRMKGSSADKHESGSWHSSPLHKVHQLDPLYIVTTEALAEEWKKGHNKSSIGYSWPIGLLAVASAVVSMYVFTSGLYATNSFALQCLVNSAVVLLFILVALQPITFLLVALSIVQLKIRSYPSAREMHANAFGWQRALVKRLCLISSFKCFVNRRIQPIRWPSKTWSLISNAWGKSSRKMMLKSIQDYKKQKTLRTEHNLTVNCLILIIFLLINVHAGNVDERFWQTNHLNYIIRITGYKDDKFLTVEDFWRIIHEDIFDQMVKLFADNINGPNFHPLSHIRLRQMRIKKVSEQYCKKYIHRKLPYLCHFDYSPDISEHRNFERGWHRVSDKPAPGYEAGNCTVGLNTKKHYYSGYGYEIMLDLERGGKGQLSYLNSSGWIDEWTRLIQVDLSVYNTDSRLATVITIAFEFTPGGIFMHATNFTFHIFGNDLRALTLQVLFTIFIILCVILTYLQVSTMYRISVSQYLSQTWNVVIIVELVLSIAMVVNVIQEWQVLNLELKKLKEIRLEGKQYEVFADISAVAAYNYKVTLISCLLATIVIIKIIFRIRHFVSVNIFLTMVGSACSLSVMPIACFILFAMCGMLLFSTKMVNFSDVAESIQCVVVLVFKPGITIQELARKFPITGHIYVVGYVWLVQYVIINMFIIFLNEVYSENKHNHRDKIGESKKGKTESEDSLLH